MSVAVLLVSHGTVDALDDLASFVTNVRRGDAPPDELVAELRRRHEAIGGHSPLNAINAELARKLEQRLSVRVAWANRLWKPYTRDVLASLVGEGIRRVAVVPLAQHSSAVYAADATRAAEGMGIELVCAPNWGQSDSLCDAFASRIAASLAAIPADDRTTLVMTAHSLPKAIVDAGDPYEREVRLAANAISRRVDARRARPPHVAVAFQSQGFTPVGRGGRPVEWLGPDLAMALDTAKARGDASALFAPVGFLADHVEILYDLDVEARAMTLERGMSFARVPSFNASDDFVEVLAEVARPLLAAPCE